MLPLIPGLKTLPNKLSNRKDSNEALECLLNMFWRPQLTIIGLEGLPSDINKAGNVVTDKLKVRCSVRIAPNQTGEEITAKIKKALLDRSKEDLFNAKIDFELVDTGNGYCPPEIPQKVKQILLESTKKVFNGNEPVYMGEGGSIPFMEIFSQEFPDTKYILTGCC